MTLLIDPRPGFKTPHFQFRTLVLRNIYCYHGYLYLNKELAWKCNRGTKAPQKGMQGDDLLPKGKLAKPLTGDLQLGIGYELGCRKRDYIVKGERLSVTKWRWKSSGKYIRVHYK